MSNGSAVEAATKRLAAALDGLDAALERKRETDGHREALAAQIVALGADRQRLAVELDEQAARSHRLEVTSREVRQRLDGAMAKIRILLNRDIAA